MSQALDRTRGTTWHENNIMPAILTQEMLGAASNDSIWGCVLRPHAE